MGLYAYGQNDSAVSISISKKSISVKEALELVKKQSGVFLMYREEAIKGLEVDLDLNGVSLTEALDKLCAEAGLRYEISNGHVLILSKAAEQVEANKDDITITGVVMDENGEPIPGASVLLKGTKNGMITDLDGRFSISYSSTVKNPQLLISFVGMASQTVNIKGRTDVKIRLASEVSDLDEVVVIGYGTAKAKDLTGSVSRINQKDIEMAPMTSNISGMLQGKAAGVNVMISSASPTSPVSVVIRGQSSLSGDGQPLWIIDGVPQYSSGISGDVSNTLYNLNLNDVQSIDILKDASATAIYGSRAANGVVIVTTKTGSEGMKPTIEFSSRVGWQVLNSNDFKTLNAEQYKAYSKQANLLEAFRQGSLTYFNKKYMDADKFNQLNTSQWDMSDIDDMWLPNAYYNGTDNYWDLMTQNALTQDYNLSLRGGTATNSYFASVNYNNSSLKIRQA